MPIHRKRTNDVDGESLSANLEPLGSQDQGAAVQGSDSEYPADDASADLSDSAVDVSEWDFGEVAPPSGGGMLRQILEEVSAVRDGAATDRVKLAEAVTGTAAGFERQLAELRDALQSAADRGDRDDEARQALAATQNEATAAAVAELRSELTDLGETISKSVTQLTVELRGLRRVLLGPD